MDVPLGKIARGGARSFIIPGAAHDKASCQKKCQGVQVENDCYGGWSCKVSNVGVIRLIKNGNYSETDF